ncbi:MAG: glycosyltransferase family 2 protein, partial [Henriciella sp.]
EGLAPPLTRYRINRGGLSANIKAQYKSWLRVRDKVRLIQPDFARKWETAAEAYQLRYLARRAIQMQDASLAL